LYSTLSKLPSTTAEAEAERKKLRTRIKLKGGDPYTQQPLVFDYLFCRVGPSTEERDANLVADLTVLHFADFAEYVADTWDRSPLREKAYGQIKDRMPVYALHLADGPQQVTKNFVRLYSFAADIIVFSDGMLVF
jgi:hypothetical protein